jgi:hypothetical protein
VCPTLWTFPSITAAPHRGSYDDVARAVRVDNTQKIVAGGFHAVGSPDERCAAFRACADAGDSAACTPSGGGLGPQGGGNAVMLLPPDAATVAAPGTNPAQPSSQPQTGPAPVASGAEPPAPEPAIEPAAPADSVPGAMPVGQAPTDALFAAMGVAGNPPEATWEDPLVWNPV